MGRITRIAATLSLPLLASCATIMNGGPDNLELRTEPAGATVYRDDVQVGVTPCLVKLDRKRGSYVLRYELEGHKVTEQTLKSNVNAAVFGNILFGGIPGLLIDTISGNMRQFQDPGEVVVLEPGEGRVAWTPAGKKMRRSEAVESASVVWKNPPASDDPEGD